jgi:hypothetical protein
MHPDYEEVKQLREEGWTWKAIGNRLGMARECARRIIGLPDWPLPIPDKRDGETPAQRAFRRFPITSHKPGPG